MDSIPLERQMAGMPSLDRNLWNGVASFGRGRRVTRVMFTGTEEGAGTTTLTAASAIGLARNLRASTTVLETHFDRPGLAPLMGTPERPGLADLLGGGATREQISAHPRTCPELTVIAAGTPREAIPGEFATDAARALLRGFATQAEFVLYDAPPILQRASTRALLDHVDGVVLVLRARSSEHREAREVIAMLASEGLPVIGVVLNRFKPEARFLA